MKLPGKNLQGIRIEMKFTQPLIFIAAFVIVTVILVFLNSVYTNIFNFDFSSSSPQPAALVSTSTVPPGIDSLKAGDTDLKIDSTLLNTASLPQDTLVGDSAGGGAAKQVTNISVNDSTPDPPVTRSLNSFTADLNKDLDIRPDSSYIKWVRATASMYETMDPKKAARIIQNYSDNIARDIIYKMKKKKAAEILAELDPSVASKIARYGG